MSKLQTSPALILEQDKNWPWSRQIPLEPTRWSKIIILDPQFIKNYPFVKNYLEKNTYQGSYFSTKTTKQRILETKHIKTDQDRQLLTIAQKHIKKKDLSTGYLLNSLLFTPDDYKVIEQHVHFRLSSSMLGPNPAVAKPIINAITRFLDENPPTGDAAILDPFAGNGSLGLIIAEKLVAHGLKNFTVINNDLSTQLNQHNHTDLSALIPERYSLVKKHLQFSQGDGITLNQIPDHSINIIVTLRALHEHSETKVRHFFKTCQKKLALNGIVIIDDVSRQPTILRRAKKMLPLLGQITAFKLVTEGKIKTDDVDALVDKIIDGDPYLAQAGIQSYISGFKLNELINIALQAGFRQPQIRGFYDYQTPFPVGSMQLRLTT